MVHKHQNKSSSRIADRTRALTHVYGTVPALQSGGLASLRRARDVSTDYSVRTHAGKNAPGSVVAMVESPAPAGRASGRWFGRMKHCGAAPAAPRSLLGPIPATRQPITLQPPSHELDLRLVYGQAKLQE